MLGNSSIAADQIGGKAQRMGPSKSLDHANRKVVLKNRGVVRVVMRNGGDTAQQVFQSAPSQAHRLGDRQVLLHRRTIRMVNVFSPGRHVGVWTPAKARKQIEFQMVVAIDQSGKNQMAIEI